MQVDSLDANCNWESHLFSTSTTNISNQLLASDGIALPCLQSKNCSK